MPTREEIREGIERTIVDERLILGYSGRLASKILSYLHSQGVVIKVERELPLISEADVEEWNEAVKRGIIVYQRFMVKEGYEATIPLVEG